MSVPSLVGLTLETVYSNDILDRIQDPMVARRCRELIKRVLENGHRLLEYVQLRLRQVSPNWQKLASVLYGVEQLHPKRRPNTTATITTTEVTFTTTYSRLPKILILLKRLESSQIVYGLIPGLDIEVRHQFHYLSLHFGQFESLLSTHC